MPQTQSWKMQLQVVRLEEISHDLVRLLGVVVEVDVVAGVGNKMALELGALEKCLGGLVKDAIAPTVADNVVILASDCLPKLARVLGRRYMTGRLTKAAPLNLLASNSPSVKVRNSETANACLNSSQY